MKHKNDHTQPLILREGEGRSYNLGPMTAIFKADENETEEKYSISEWWLEPHSTGPGAHEHDDQDQIFYVLEGTLSMLGGDKWVEGSRGTFIRIPKNTMHTFENRTDKKITFLNFDVPGGFEKHMPEMSRWFDENK